MKTGRDIGVGILGTGFGVTAHYPAWSSLAGVRVVGFASRDAERASRMSRQFELLITTGTQDAILTSPDVDIIVVAVPPAVQPTLIEAALESGKHVFAEKPLAPSVEEGARLVALAERKGLCHGVNFCLRRAPASALLKRTIVEGRIGKPWRAVVTWHRGHRAQKDLEWNWKCDAGLGGGVMNALGVHILDLLIWLFAEASGGWGVRQVNIPRRRDPSGREHEVTAEDAVNVMVGFANKVMTFVSLDSTAIGGTGLSADIYGEDGSLHMRQASEHGALAGLSLSLTDKGGKTVALLSGDDREDDDQISLIRAMAHDFVKAVRERRAFSPSFVDGLRVASASARLRWVA